MYVAMLTLFAAQAFGLDLRLADYFVIAGTTTIVAMGAAPVPSGSLFVLAAVLHAICITPEQTAIVVGFILPFDPLLDMIRTIPNRSADHTSELQSLMRISYHVFSLKQHINTAQHS